MTTRSKALLNLPDGGTLELTDRTTHVDMHLRSPGGVDVIDVELPVHIAAYVAGWLAVAAGVDVAGLTRGALGRADSSEG